MMAYQSLVHSVKKYCPVYVILGFALSLPIDFLYNTPQKAVYATTNVHILTSKQKLQEAHQLMGEFIDVEQERQKTSCDRSENGPKYKIGEEVLVSTDSESNIKSEDQTEAQTVINPLSDTNGASDN